MKINITLPCYNEEKILKDNVLKIFNFLTKNIVDDDWKIIIADNQSADATGKIGREMAKKYDEIKYVFTEKKGKGMAIKIGWKKYASDIYIFMDADLATDIRALPDLISAIKKDGFNIAAGSRFHKDSSVKRSLVRKFISKSYRFIKKIITKSNIADAPCGFKAIDQKTFLEVLPLIKNNEWFFDSELLIIAEKKKYKIKEIPVKWEDLREGNDKSKVKILSLGIEYLKNILEIKKRLKNIN